MKPRIAIFDLTDCEGCELQFLGLKEKLLEFAQDYEIANWRLVQPNQGDLPEIDVAIIQGTIITKADAELVKKVRDKSKYLVAIGECARTCGVFAGSYAVVGPVDAVVPVDVHVDGCPPEPADILRGILTALGRPADEGHRS